IDAPAPYMGGPGGQLGGPLAGQFSGAGFPGGQHFGAQSGAFGMPSGLGAGPGFPPMNSGMGPSNGPFDQRSAAEQAFSAGGAGVPNGLYNQLQNEDMQLSFLSGGLGGLSLGDDGRRKELNGGH